MSNRRLNIRRTFSYLTRYKRRAYCAYCAAAARALHHALHLPSCTFYPLQLPTTKHTLPAPSHAHTKHMPISGPTSARLRLKLASVPLTLAYNTAFIALAHLPDVGGFSAFLRASPDWFLSMALRAIFTTRWTPRLTRIYAAVYVSGYARV